MIRKIFILTLFLPCLLLSSVAMTQNENPFIGTWDIDKSESNFGDAPVPTTMSRTYADLGNGMYMYLVATMNQNGSLGGSSATYRYDGEAYPIASLDQLDAAYISYRRLNERTVEYRVTLGGVLNQIGAKSISADGRTLTIAIQFPNSEQNLQILKFDRRR